MAYSEDYRRRAVEYYQEGHTQGEVQAAFKIQNDYPIKASNPRTLD